MYSRTLNYVACSGNLLYFCVFLQLNDDDLYAVHKMLGFFSVFNMCIAINEFHTRMFSAFFVSSRECNALRSLQKLYVHTHARTYTNRNTDLQRKMNWKQNFTHAHIYILGSLFHKQNLFFSLPKTHDKKEEVDEQREKKKHRITNGIPKCVHEKR